MRDLTIWRSVDDSLELLYQRLIRAEWLQVCNNSLTKREGESHASVETDRGKDRLDTHNTHQHRQLDPLGNLKQRKYEEKQRQVMPSCDVNCGNYLLTTCLTLMLELVMLEELTIRVPGLSSVEERLLAKMWTTWENNPLKRLLHYLSTWVKILIPYRKMFDKLNKLYFFTLGVELHQNFLFCSLILLSLQAQQLSIMPNTGHRQTFTLQQLQSPGRYNLCRFFFLFLNNYLFHAKLINQPLLWKKKITEIPLFENFRKHYTFTRVKSGVLL